MNAFLWCSTNAPNIDIGKISRPLTMLYSGPLREGWYLCRRFKWQVWTMRRNIIVLTCLILYWFCSGDGLPFASVLPVILNKEQHHLTQASLNETVCLPCEVRSESSTQSGKVLFYWRKDNVILWPHPRYRRLDNLCLQIRNVEAQDAGYYTCHAHNIHGKDDVERLLVINGHMPDRPTSTTVPLRTRLPPVIFPGDRPPRVLEAEELLTRRVKVGSKVKLPCSVSGSPTPSVVWFKNKVLLSSETSTRYVFKPSKLVINNFKKSDAGNFSCVAKNKLGSSNVTYLIRLEKDRNFTGDVQSVQESLTLRPGDNVTLDCVVKKGNIKILHWYVPTRPQSRTSKQRSDQERAPSFAASVLHNRVFIINSSHILRYYLFNVSDEDSGKYTCLAGFKGQKKSFPVKMITISVSEARVSTNQEDKRGFHMPLFLMISIPLVAGLLCITIVVLCWKCHVKRRKQPILLQGFSGEEEDDGDDGVLGPVPSGSLRMHRPSLHNAGDRAHVCRSSSENLYFSLDHLDLHDRPLNDCSCVRQVRSSFYLPTPVCNARTRVELASQASSADACELSPSVNDAGEATAPPCTAAQLCTAAQACTVPQLCTAAQACTGAQLCAAAQLCTATQLSPLRRNSCAYSDSFLESAAVDLLGRIRLKSARENSSPCSKSLADLVCQKNDRTSLPIAHSFRTTNSSAFLPKISGRSRKHSLSTHHVPESGLPCKVSTNSDAGCASANSPFLFELDICDRRNSCNVRSKIPSDAEWNFDVRAMPFKVVVDSPAHHRSGEAVVMLSGSTFGVVSSCSGEFLLSRVRASEYTGRSFVI